VPSGTRLHARCVAAQQIRNIGGPSFLPRPCRRPRRKSMEIVGMLMLGSVALWIVQQFERNEW
jgi:hypothetical protein